MSDRVVFPFQIERLSPAALAYLGDAVYELYIRTYFLLPPRRISDYHNRVVARVRAESQAEQLQFIFEHLTESEKEIVRQGRNAVNRKPQRLDAEVYQQATGWETLIGYLYLMNIERLHELFSLLEFESIE
ncbi:MAG: Mini-ribonuclease 3 [Cyanobacteria bacterium SBLK]|nr:Mini-ribonuclease 3 [Cyanobacteria bacterium SBLK]